MATKKKTEAQAEQPAAVAETHKEETRIQQQEGNTPVAEEKEETKKKETTPKQATQKKPQLTLAILAERVAKLADVVTRVADGMREDTKHTNKLTAIAAKEAADTSKLLNEVLKQQSNQANIIEGLNDQLTQLEKNVKIYKAHAADCKSTNDAWAKLHARIQALEHPKAAVIEIKPLDPNKQFLIPTPSKDGSIGDDLELSEDLWVNHGRNIVPLNICINLPRGIEGKIEPRSGFSARGIWGKYIQYVSDRIFWLFHKPAVEVTVDSYMNADVIDGKIDPGYHNGLGILIYNRSVPFCIPAGTRLAQITYYKTCTHRYKKVEEFSNEAPYVSDRQGGFGSSNKEEEQHES